MKLLAAPDLLMAVERNRAAMVAFANTVIAVGESDDESERQKVQLEAGRFLDSGDDAVACFKRWRDLPSWTADTKRCATSPEAIVDIGVRAMLRCVSVQVLVVAGSFSPNPDYQVAVSELADPDWSTYRTLMGPVAAQTVGHLYQTIKGVRFLKQAVEILQGAEAVLDQYASHGYQIVRMLADRAR